jgi:hypothetical protein
MFLRFSTGTLSLLALTAGLAMKAPASSILSDGGFETPNVTPGASQYTTNLGDGFWNVTQGGIQIFNTAIGEGAVPHSGNQFAYLDDGNTPNTLSQTLATTVGQSYVVSYWVADNDPNSLVVNFGDQNLFTGLAPTLGVGAAGDYVNATFIVTADAPSTNLTFTGQWLGFDGDYGTILDDVSVTAASAPEPATLAFSASGLLWLFSLRRPLKTPAPRG